jgi:hypothetical protein
MSRNGSLKALKKICNPVEGNWSTRNHAKQQFGEFVMKTFQGLYALESKIICGKSSICVFCRLDIGLIQNGNIIHYFVNEVERTQTASLWTNPPKSMSTAKCQIGLFGSTFAQALYNWLQEISNPSLL